MVRRDEATWEWPHDNLTRLPISLRIDHISLIVWPPTNKKSYWLLFHRFKGHKAPKCLCSELPYSGGDWRSVERSVGASNRPADETPAVMWVSSRRRGFRSAVGWRRNWQTLRFCRRSCTERDEKRRVCLHFPAEENWCIEIGRDWSVWKCIRLQHENYRSAAWMQAVAGFVKYN